MQPVVRLLDGTTELEARKGTMSYIDRNAWMSAALEHFDKEQAFETY